MLNKNEIVSIALITYNSSDTVRETLNSILNQVYELSKIELIISDDASTDDTTKVIDLWVNKHSACFFRIVRNYHKKNLGVSGNCNSAWKCASGEWIKTIAGDDILTPNNIMDNVAYVRNIPCANIAVVFSEMEQFYTSPSGEYITNLILPPDYQKKILSSNNNLLQRKYMQAGDISGAPSAFIRTTALAAIDFADEKFTLMEDYPVWCKLLDSGWSFSFMDKLTVRYRIGNSITNNKEKLVNVKHLQQLKQAHRLYCGGAISLLRQRKILWINMVLLLSKLFRNKRTDISFFLLKVITLIRPFFITYKIEMLSSRKKKNS